MFSKKVVLLLLAAAGVISADDLVATTTEAGTSTSPSDTTVSQSPPPPPSIKSLHVDTNIAYRYARTLITSRVVNPSNDVAQEINFSVILPETAFISGFLMELNGKVYKAYVKEKEEAKKIYNQAVSSGQTAAHVALSARDSNRFTVSMNVEPQQKVTFNLTYEELLTRTSGLYKHTMNLDPGQIIEDLSVKVNITESSPIYRVEVPSLRENNEIIPSTSENVTQDALARIDRQNPKSVIIYWNPSADEQKDLRAEGIKGQLEVLYDVEREAKGEILINDGYFVHFYAPKDLPPLPKHVVFVLDVSGSMSGKKMEQLREAMVLILGDLHDKDYFSIVLFHSTVSIWNPNSPNQQDIEGINPNSILRANPENIAKAKEFAKSLQALYSTNIDDALAVGLEITEVGANETVKAGTVPPPERMMVFLTDGQPNQGESDPNKIISNVANKIDASSDKTVIFSLGFGNDADMTFLRKLSLNNSGFAKKIYEAADATLQLRDFYDQISSPLLADVTFKYQPEDVKTKTITRHRFRTFFLGSELVVAGQLEGPKKEKISGQLEARGAEGQRTSITLPKPLTMDYIEWPYPIIIRENTEPGIAERVWAYLTIQQLLDEEKTGNEESKKKALDLALKYSFVTPVTSLVVVKPNETKSIEAEDASNTNRPGFGLNHFVQHSPPLIPLSGGGLALNRPYAASRPFQAHGNVLYSVRRIISMRPRPLPTFDNYNGFAGGLSAMAGPPGQIYPMAGGSFDKISGGFAAPDVDLAINYESEIIMEEEVSTPFYISTTYAPTFPLTSSTTIKNKQVVVSLEKIQWLNDATKANSTHLEIDSQYYLIKTTETNTPFNSCSIEELPNEEAHCRYFQYCSLEEYSDNYDIFKKRFCNINGNAGVCCPDNTIFP